MLQFRSRFLHTPEVSAIESPSFSADPSLSLVSTRELEVGKLAKETLIAFMQYSKGEGAKVYYRLTTEQRQARAEFMFRHRDWGNSYDRLCKALQRELADLVIQQKQHLDEALRLEGESLLQRQRITEAMLESSLREHLSDSLVQQLVRDANSYPPPQSLSLPLERLYEIFAYRTGRAKTLRRCLPSMEPEKQLVVLLILIADETFQRFEITDEQANWAFKHAKVERDSAYVQRFSSLQRDFDEACGGLKP